MDDELKNLIESQFTSRLGELGIEAVANIMATIRDARSRIDEEGMIVKDSKGNPVPHPAIAIEKSASAELRQWIGSFGKR